MKELSFAVTPAGHMPGNEHRQFDDCIRSMAGKRVVVTVKEYKKKRSNPQNRYYFGCVIPLVTKFFRDAGNMVDGDDVHNYLKLRVGKLAQIFVTPDGEVIKSLGSTAKLSTIEFEVYMTNIRAWAAEYGLQIPEPNEIPIDAYTD
jgi:hypothetical protein